jgi:nitrous oxidase accessory protein NosD
VVVLAVVLATAGLIPTTTAQADEQPPDVPSPGASDCTPHPPIQIDGDEPDRGFTTETPTGEAYRPGSGVVAGEGTAENPYVIAGWCLTSGQTGQATVNTRIPDQTPLKPPRPAIQIESTPAHVVVRDNVIAGEAKKAQDRGPDTPGPVGGLVPQTAHVGVDLFEVGHVTVQDNRIEQNTIGVDARLADQVEVLDNRFDSQAYLGINVNAETIHVEGNELNDTGIEVAGAQTVVADNRVQDAGVGIQVLRSLYSIGSEDPTVIRNNHVEDAWTGVDLFHADDVIVDANTLDTGSYGVHARQSTGVELVNNDVNNYNDRGVVLDEVTNVLLVDNRIHDNERGVTVEGSETVELRHNALVENRVRGLALVDTVDVRVVDNQIEDNIRGIEVAEATAGLKIHRNNIPLYFGVASSLLVDDDLDPVDATNNGWGCTDQPTEPGTCEAVDGPATVDPIATSPFASSGPR